MVLDGPVDPDRVTCVSRDSLVALVECQVRSIFSDVAVFISLSIENSTNILHLHMSCFNVF